MMAKGCLVPVLLAGLMGCQQSTPPKVAPEASVSGVVWLNKKKGGPELLRGIEVFLCHRSAQDAINQEGARLWAANAEELAVLTKTFRQSSKGGASAQDVRSAIRRMKSEQAGYFQKKALLLENMRSVVRSVAMSVVRTDTEAKYEFSKVPAGSYLIFATFEFDFAAGCWELPVEVQGVGPLRIDLQSSNLADYSKSGAGPWEVANPPSSLPLEWEPVPIAPSR